MQIDSTELRYFIKTSTTLCQNASKVHKVTATEQTESLTFHQNSRYGTPTPSLRPSESIFRIYIRCLFDWCMIQVKQVVRSDRNRTKGQPLTTAMKHSPINQKRRYGTPTPNLRPSDSIFRIYIWFLFDWCMIRVKQMVRRDRNCKKGQQQKRKKHLPFMNKSPDDSSLHISIDQNTLP